MQLYLNYKQRALVFTQEMLVAMGRPAYVEMRNDHYSSLMFVPRKKQSEGICWEIPDKIYEDEAACAVGFRTPLAHKLKELIGKDIPAVASVMPLYPLNEDVAKTAQEILNWEPIGRLILVYLKDMETFFYTDELDKVYDQETLDRLNPVGEDHVFVG